MSYTQDDISARKKRGPTALRNSRWRRADLERNPRKALVSHEAIGGIRFSAKFERPTNATVTCNTGKKQSRWRALENRCKILLAPTRINETESEIETKIQGKASG